ncbi:hypothetical protein D6833_09900 [Candidatus Parcubacteria bacterium]|nr:MAG: hypothetical protein D6833_09900 [Candidatus Parcubacteria bacterium]
MSEHASSSHESTYHCLCEICCKEVSQEPGETVPCLRCRAGLSLLKYLGIPLPPSLLAWATVPREKILILRQINDHRGKQK